MCWYARLLRHCIATAKGCEGWFGGLRWLKDLLMAHSLTSPVAPLPIGLMLKEHHYKLLGVHQQDDWCITYLAFDQFRKQEVWLHELVMAALVAKRAEDGQIGAKPDMEDEFARLKAEWLAFYGKLARLHHPVLHKPHQVWEELGTVYYTELPLEGSTVKDLLLQGGSYGEQVAVTLIGKVAEALAELHQHELTHQQITPSNIWVSPEGEPIIAEFGQLKQQAFRRAGQHLNKLTLSYTALEVLRKDGQISEATDVYSLAGVLYQMLTSTRPEVASQRIETPMPSAQHFAKGISDHLNHVVDKALALRPEDRYADMLAFRDDLLSIPQHQSKGHADISSESQSVKRLFNLLIVVAMLGLLALVVLTIIF